jgi:SAM-dependent methyltransferase
VLAYTKDTRPDSPVAVIASGLAGRVALKTAAADRRMDLLVILTGIVDLQLACLSVHQEDFIVTFLRGTRRGTSNLLGMQIDVDHFLQDAIKEGYADLRTTLRDAQQIRVPVMFFATHEEAGGSVSAVNEVREMIAPQALSQVFPIPQTLQQLHDNPRKEWAMFRQLVSCCMTHLSPTAAAREMIEPAQMEIGRQNRLERQRAKAHRPIGRPGSKEFGHAYLDHFHCLANIPEYWHLLDQISRLLGPMEKGATILDAGCGPGNLGMCMLLKDSYHRRGSCGPGFNGLRYVGVEVAQSVLARAAVNFSNVGNDALVVGGDRHDPSTMETSLTCADLNRPLPFRDHQFSRVICNLVLGYLDDPMSSLLELVRVLSPDGLIVVTSLKPYADLIEIYKNFMLRTDLPEEIEEAERLLNTACKIKQAEGDGLFRSFQPDEIAMLLIMSGASEPQVSSTFGNQAYIVAAKKPRHDEHDEGVPEYLTQESTFATAIPTAGTS